MKLDDLVKSILENYSNERKINDLAQQLDIEQSTLSRAVKGQKLGLDKVAKILAHEGYIISKKDPQVPTIQRVSPHAPIEPVIGDNLINIPVYAYAGAGNPMQNINIEPISFLPILKEYFRVDLFIVKVIGDSMEPLIKKGAHVGVIPFAGHLHEGGIYLIHDRYFGEVIKRIKKDSSGRLILVSENSKYEPQILDFSEDSDNNILAEVVWIWQMV